MVLIYDDSEISINKKKKNEFVMLIKNWDGDYNKFWDNFPVSLMKVVKIDAKSEDTQEIVIKGDLGSKKWGNNSISNRYYLWIWL